MGLQKVSDALRIRRPTQRPIEGRQGNAQAPGQLQIGGIVRAQSGAPRETGGGLERSPTFDWVDEDGPEHFFKHENGGLFTDERNMFIAELVASF